MQCMRVLFFILQMSYVQCCNLRCGVLDVPHILVVYFMELLLPHENLKAKQFTTKAAGEKL